MADRQTDIAELIAAVAAGDRIAFDRLYEATAPKLFGLILRMLRDRPLAEDVLQDVFVRIWTKAATFSPGAGDPLAWMASIARHRAIDQLRARPALQRVEESYEGWFENLPDRRDGERDLLNADVLRHCLAALDDETRSCVLQAYCAGASGQELAARFGRPENTIKTRLRRGLAALRACVEKSA